MLIERGVAVTMREGVQLRVDVFRLNEPTTNLPVLIAWAPLAAGIT